MSNEHISEPTLRPVCQTRRKPLGKREKKQHKPDRRTRNRSPYIDEQGMPRRELKEWKKKDTLLIVEVKREARIDVLRQKKKKVNGR